MLKEQLKLVMMGNNQTFTVKSSNPAVAYVGAGNAIKTVKAGTTTITITAGATTKSFTLTVSADDARVASEATATPTSTKLVAGMEGSEKEFELAVTDQFGEVFTGNVFVELPTVEVEEVEANLVDFVGDATSTVAITDGEGSFTVTGTTAGEGNVVVKDEEDGTTLATVGVDVSDDLEVAAREFEIVAGESDDLTIDAYADGSGDEIVQDTTVNFALNQYNEAGYYVGKEALQLGAQAANKYTVQVKNDIGANVTINNNEVAVTAGTKAGAVEIVISNGATVVAKKTVTVKNSTPEIEDVNFKSVETISEAGVDINAATVLTFNEETGLVSGVDVSTNEEVYFDAASLTLYVDKDGVNGLGTNDLEIGSLAFVADSGLAVVANTEYVTVAGNSGNVIFTVTDSEGKTVDTTSVAVEVPAEEA